MNALLIVAHGSRRAASNQDVRLLAERIRALDNDSFDIVLPAFLELADPDIGSGVDRCVELGASRITVMPYFLSPGRHVAEDIPSQLEQAKQRHPGIDFDLRRHIGGLDLMPEMVLRAASGEQQAPPA
jgi:sirohydrochlorin ferrochelatase